MVIISHKHKFIYIKSYKTASTSLQIFLSKFCGDDDILTPIEPANTELGISYNKQARNYQGYYSHMGAEEIRNRVGDDIWNQYFRFTFERNPWDKAVSFYHFYKVNKELDEDFDDWIVKWIKRDKGPSNYDLYTIDNKIAVDFIGQYKHLERDLKIIFDKINLSLAELPKEKSSYREDKQDYRSYFNKKTKKLVMKRNKKEILLFGYEF
jgi:hypothetical protein